jgi:hypothetical protein
MKLDDCQAEVIKSSAFLRVVRPTRQVIAVRVGLIECFRITLFVVPSDAVQEFKVQTNTFDAQDGYTASATVNVAVKSGTNDLHGSVW